MTYWQKKGSKYGAKKATYGESIYHSKKEAGYAQELDLRVKAKDIKSWERQVRIPLVVNGYKICDYTIDFVVTHNDKTKEYVEVKGFFTPEFRLKWKLFEALFSDEFSEKDWRMTIIT